MERRNADCWLRCPAADSRINKRLTSGFFSDRAENFLDLGYWLEVCAGFKRLAEAGDHRSPDDYFVEQRLSEFINIQPVKL